MSATMTNDVQALKGLALRNPVSPEGALFVPCWRALEQEEAHHFGILTGRPHPVRTVLLVILDAVQHAHDGSRQVSRPLRPPQIEARQGKELDIRQHRREGV